jgi:hypothetical protein
MVPRMLRFHHAPGIFAHGDEEITGSLFHQLIDSGLGLREILSPGVSCRFCQGNVMA